MAYLLLVVCRCAQSQIVTEYYQSDARMFGNSYTFTKTDSTAKEGTFIWQVNTDDGGGWSYVGTFSETSKYIYLKYQEPVDSNQYLFMPSGKDTDFIWVSWYQAGHHFVARSGNAFDKWNYSTLPFDTSSHFIIPKVYMLRKGIIEHTIIVKAEENSKDSVIVKLPECNVRGVVVYYTTKWVRKKLSESSTKLTKTGNGFIAIGMWEKKKDKKVLFIKK